MQVMFLHWKLNELFFIKLHFSSVIRATVPKLELDAAFEQKNDIAKAVEEELEKVLSCILSLQFVCYLWSLRSMDSFLIDLICL
jgi:hypothetical protein